MPWKTAKQERWGNSPAGIAAMGKAKVNEFNQASKGMKLPEHVKKYPSLMGRTHIHKVTEKGDLNG